MAAWSSWLAVSAWQAAYRIALMAGQTETASF